MRFSNGKPFMETITAHWMLVQWDWRREPFNKWFHSEWAAHLIRTGEELT